MFGLPGTGLKAGGKNGVFGFSHPQRLPVHGRRDGPVQKHGPSLQSGKRGASLARGGHAAPVRQRGVCFPGLLYRSLYRPGGGGAHRGHPRHARRLHHPAGRKFRKENRLRRRQSEYMSVKKFFACIIRGPMQKIELRGIGDDRLYTSSGRQVSPRTRQKFRNV